MKRTIPNATVERLPVYLNCLDALPEGEERVSSEQLAALAGENPAKVRKDLSHLGSYGTRGVGYDVELLRFQIRRVLGLSRDWRVVVVGVGNLGRALAGYGGFRQSGFRVVGLFDTAPEIVGVEIGGIPVEPLESLRAAVAERGAAIGVIAVPAEVAQDVADRLAAAGITSILNFAPAVIRVPDTIEVRQVDLSMELQVLSFYLHTARESA